MIQEKKIKVSNIKILLLNRTKNVFINIKIIK